MKKRLILFVIGVLLGSFVCLTGVSGELNISYTDPTGDVVSYGVTPSIVDDADITSLGVDTASDPMVVEITVVGTHNIVESATDYICEIYFDHNGDYIADSYIRVTSEGNLVFVNGMPSEFYGSVAGDGTSTLSVEVYWEILGLSEEITDIYGKIMLGEGEGGATDDINLYFTGGGGDDTDDDDTDDDTDDDGEIDDPADDTPTDPSIDIEITDFSISLEEMGEKIHMVWDATGTASQGVDHCSFLMTIETAEDGLEGMVGDEWTDGPMDFTYEDSSMVFKGTGSGGENDWSEWSLHISLMAEKEDPEETSIPEEEIEDVKHAIFYIRAYSDISEADWNQDSYEFTQELKDEAADMGWMDGEDGNGDDSPGLGLTLVVATTISMAAILLRRRR